MLFQVPLHPLIVHFPVVLIIMSALFDLVGRATDASWWRKASLALLVAGVLGGVAAVLTGESASDIAEKRQGIPEATVEHHEDVAKLSIWIAGGALAARLVEVAGGPARGLIGGLALLLQLASAITIGIAGHRGGMLVYRHGAGVEIAGQLVREPGAKPEAGEGDEHAGKGPQAEKPH